MSEYSSSMEAIPMASSMIFRIGAPALGRKGWSNVAIGILYRGRFPTTDNPSPEEIISFIIGSDDPMFMLPSGWEVTTAVLFAIVRSEERRVGKECRSWRWSDSYNKKNEN